MVGVNQYLRARKPRFLRDLPEEWQMVATDAMIALVAALIVILVNITIKNWLFARPRLQVQWQRARVSLTGPVLSLDLRTIPSQAFEIHLHYVEVSVLAKLLGNRLRRDGLRLQLSLEPPAALVCTPELRSSPTVRITSNKITFTCAAELQPGTVAWADLSIEATPAAATSLAVRCNYVMSSDAVWSWLLARLVVLESEVTSLAVTRS